MTDTMQGLTVKHFDLDPYQDHAEGLVSREAILDYADSIVHSNYEQAFDLIRWVAEIESGFEETTEA